MGHSCCTPLLAPAGPLAPKLAVDSEGTLHVLELKRDRTPREAIAQVLDYGSWVSGLSHDQVLEIFSAYRPDVAFEEAFAVRFDNAPPAELNTAQRLTVIASGVDSVTERIVTYLNTGFGVPVNVVLFRYYADGDREYLARTWLLDEPASPTHPVRAARGGSGEEWNGQDWYVSFGEEPEGRNWSDARRLGFVSAGGGAWFSRTIRALPVGARVFACIPKAGYVGVGKPCGCRMGHPRHATWAYSWISPPSRSRRRRRESGADAGGGSGLRGAA